MAFLDRFLGRNITLNTPAPTTADEQAVERYEYLLRAGRPDTIEKAHVDAFDKLTPEQRDLVFERFTTDPPAGARPADATSVTLARTATRAEARQPGILARIFSGTRVETGNRDTAVLGSSFLSTFATYAIASTAIDTIFWVGLIGTTVIATDADANSADTSSSFDAGNGTVAGDFLGGFDF